MTLSERMKFGVFTAPFHSVGENRTLVLDRDLKRIEWLDFLGFDEAYIGEHHSAGWDSSRGTRMRLYLNVAPFPWPSFGFGKAAMQQ